MPTTLCNKRAIFGEGTSLIRGMLHLRKARSTHADNMQRIGLAIPVVQMKLDIHRQLYLQLLWKTILTLSWSFDGCKDSAEVRLVFRNVVCAAAAKFQSEREHT